MTDRYVIAGEDVAAEDFEGDLVVLNLRTGLYFGFNAPASAIWTALTNGNGLPEIADAGADRDALDGFVSKLVEYELVKPSDDAQPATGASVPAAVGDGEPVIEVFEDLADLIMADPIHDVDQQAGWPHVPKA